MEKRLDICFCSRSRLQKVSNRKSQCEDRLSWLPDEILYFIQSFLKYEEVTQMSILSRRWLKLWKHAPVLQFGVPILLDQHLCAPIVTDRRNQKPECHNFVSTIRRVFDGSLISKPERMCDELSFWIRNERNQMKEECDKSTFWMTSHTPDEINQKGECDKIVNWMSRVSKMHKGPNSNELKVSYTLYKSYKKKDIDSWWEDTLAGEYQKLELDFLSIDSQDSTSYVFPDRLLSFCSDCLFWTLSFDSHFLESSGFKSLKSLSLNGVLITHKSTDFILVNCPFLERLEVVESPVLLNFQIENGESLALKHLKIEECVNLRFIDIIYSNVVSLEISAPLLLTLKKLPRLIELSIIEGSPTKCRRDSLCQPELKTLTLNPDKPKALLKQFKVISPLTKLQRFVVLVDALGDESLTGLIAFINVCPLLKEFVLMLNWINPCRSNKMVKKKPEKCSHCGSNKMVKKKPEKCSHKHLKVVEFLGYYGRVSDVKLTVHLMENADNLEKVIIDPWNPENREHDYEEEAKARTLALLQLKQYVPPLVQFIIR